MMKRLLLVSLLILPTVAADVFGADASQVMAPFVDETTVLVAAVGLSDAEIERHAQQLIDAGLPAAQVQSGIQMIVAARALLVSAGVNTIYFGLCVSDIRQDSLFPVFAVIPLDEEKNSQLIGQLLTRFSVGFTDHAEIRGALVAGPSHVIERLKTAAPQPRPDMTAALSAVGEFSVRMALLPPDGYARVVRETLVERDERIGLTPGPILAEGQWLAVGKNPGESPKANVIVQTASEEAASELRQRLESVCSAVAANPDIHEDLPDFRQLADALVPSVEGDRLVLRIGGDGLAVEEFLANVVPVTKVILGLNDRSQSVKNLKRIALAMHVFHDRHKSFPPPASYDSAGQPLLSWRVQLLPYLGEEALYERFHLDEPWDSEHNRSLIEEIPEAYQTPTIKALESGHTCYLVPVGEGALFEGNHGKQFREISDGSSNTIMIVEAAADQAVPWTKPQDFAIDEIDVAKRLVGLRNAGFLAAFADASVQFINDEVAAETLRLLFLIADGQPIGNYR